MKFIIFFLSLFFCFQALSDLTEGNPAVIEYLKKQKAEAEASGEVTTPKNSSSPTSGSSYGPPRTVIENEMCTSELKIFAARPSKSAPSLMTCQMQLDTRFAEHLKEYIPFCAKKAALKDDMQAPLSVSLEQMGGFNVRKINTPTGSGDSWSRHSLGMALDVSAITLNMGTYTKKIELTDKTQNPLFYKEFRSCWDLSLEKHMGKESCTCSIGHSHAHEPSNELHDDHMHISLTCPPQASVAGC